MRDQVTAIPDGADFASAAAFGVTYRTAYHALRSVAQVAEGDWVVVLGAAGGVGLAARRPGGRDEGPGAGGSVEPRRSSSCAGSAAREATVDYDREELKSAHPRAHRRRRPRGHRPGRGTLRRAGAARSCSRRDLRHAGLRRGHDTRHPAESGAAQGITVRGMEIRTFMRRSARRLRARHAGAGDRCSPTAGSGLTSVRGFALADTAAALRLCGRPQGDRQGGHRRRLNASRRDDVERRIGPVEDTQKLLQGRLVAGDLQPR